MVKGENIMMKVKLAKIADTRASLDNLLGASYNDAFEWDLIRNCAPLKQAIKDYDTALESILKNNDGTPVEGGMVQFAKEHAEKATKQFNTLREREVELEVDVIMASTIQSKVNGNVKASDILALDYLIEIDITKPEESPEKK